MGGACLLRPGFSDGDLFRYCQGVIYFDARYLMVLSILLPAGNRIDYLPCRTMSRRAVTRFVINANG